MSLLFSLSLSLSLSVMLMSFGFCILDALKVSPNEDVKETDVKEVVVCKDDQLALDVKGLNLMDEVTKDGKTDGKRAKSFTFDELEEATNNFRADCFQGEGGFGTVYRAKSLTFDELAQATNNFRADCFLGEGGFGKVYKGHLAKINQVGWNQFDFRISLFK
jgi:hypothetical protein